MNYTLSFILLTQITFAFNKMLELLWALSGIIIEQLAETFVYHFYLRHTIMLSSLLYNPTISWNQNSKTLSILLNSFGNDEIDNISLLHVISTNQHSIYTGFPNILQAELWSYEINNHDQIVTNNLRT